MKQFTILHLSDLHWCENNNADLQIVLTALYEDLAKLEKDGIKPDIAIFSGDLAMGGDDVNEIEKAWNALIVPISEKTGLSLDRIFVAPGNHDMSREAVRGIPSIEKNIRQMLVTSEAIGSFIDGSSKPDTETSLALRRVENFFTVHDYYHQSAVGSSPFHRTFKVEISGSLIGVACLNSAWRATGESDDVDYGRLIIGERALDKVLTELSDCDYKIAVHHHPLDWLVPADRQAVDFLFKRHFDLTCCGHMHVARPQSAQDSNGLCITSQAGSAYASRKWFNGYNLIQVDLPTRDHTFFVRSYINDSRRFDRATIACPDGTMVLRGERPKDQKRSELVELFLRGNRQLLREKVATQLNIIGSETTSTDQLIKQFIAPPITLRGDESAGDPDAKETTKELSISEIVGKDGNLLILGERQSGKTSLAHYLAYEIACVKADCYSVPVVLNLKDMQYNKYSLKRSINNFYDEIPQEVKIDDYLENGVFLFIVDNVPTKEAELLKFAELIKQFDKCRWIVLGTPNNDSVSPYRLFNENFHNFEQLRIRELNRAGIRTAARNWTQGSEDQATIIYNSVMRQIVRDGLPRTPYMVSLLVWAFQQKLDRQHLNEATLLENIVDHLIGKADFTNSGRGVFSAQAKQITLQSLAYFMFEKGGIATRNETEAFLIEFFNARALPFIASTVLGALISCNILKRDHDSISFKYPCFQEYFLACKFNAEGGFLKSYLVGVKFLKVRRELELLAGLRQQNDDLIDAITSTLDIRMPKDIRDCDIGDFSGPDRPELKVGTTKSQLNKIKEKRLTSAQFDEMMDEVDRRAMSRGHMAVSERIERADGDLHTALVELEAEAIAQDADSDEPIKPATYMAAIDILARIIRNSDFTTYDVKGPATRSVVASWIKAFILIQRELNEVFKTIGERSGDPIKSDEFSTLKYIFSKLMFGVVGHAVIGHLSSPSMSQTIKEILADEGVSIGERLLLLFLLEDMNDTGWQERWASIVRDKSQPGFVIDIIIAQLMTITHSKALDDDQATRVQQVVLAIEKRLGLTTVETNQVSQSFRDVATLASMVDKQQTQAASPK